MSGKRHIDRLDLLRALAIMMVFFHHYWLIIRPEILSSVEPFLYSPFGKLLFSFHEMGYLGVRLFFVLSGFCIHYSFLNWMERNGGKLDMRRFLPDYFWRRFWRIYPPYFAFLVLFFLYQYWEDLDFAAVKHFLVHATLSHTLGKAFYYNINPSFWSIAVEWQLYMIYPVFLWVRRWKGIRLAFVGATVVSVFAAFAVPQFTDSFLFQNLPFKYWFEWTLGALMAERFREGRSVFRFQGWLVLLGLPFCCLGLHSSNVFDFAIPSLVFAVCIEWVIGLKARPKFWEKPFVWAGVFSYSTYLLHQPLQYSIVSLLPEPTWRQNIVVGTFLLPLALYIPFLAASYVSFHLIEMKSVAVGKSIWKRVSKPIPTVQAASR
ncbi:MAG: acyltransferase [Verrucomicrobiota bacterium]